MPILGPSICQDNSVVYRVLILPVCMLCFKKRLVLWRVAHIIIIVLVVVWLLALFLSTSHWLTPMLFLKNIYIFQSFFCHSLFPLVVSIMQKQGGCVLRFAELVSFCHLSFTSSHLFLTSKALFAP